MRKFLQLHLKTNKQLAAAGNRSNPAAFSPNSRLVEKKSTITNIAVEVPSNRSKSRTQGGGLLESEMQLCQISEILNKFLDLQCCYNNAKSLQSCISNQVCLSEREFPT